MRAFAIGTLLVAILGGAVMGAQMSPATPAGNGDATAAPKGFVYWCTKPTPEIVAWGVSYRERKGLEPEFGAGLAARLAFWNACRCASKQMPADTSPREMEMAGKIHGLHIKLDFSKFADEQQRQALKEEGQGLAVEYEDILEGDPQWAKNLTSKFRECQRVF
ncbi:MAG: hypothetical protein AAFN43_06210 [Pseudomonadota bacterium]